jgi:D-inositol-3-phosphate glycosyltransferase
MTRRIALISEHASPLASLGGTDAGGQNVYVDHVARELARRGDRVEVFTRRDDPRLPDVVTLAPGVRVVHVPAGPPEAVPKEQLLEHMGEFRDWMLRRFRDGRHPVDLVHANFWMSGLVAAELRRALDVPFVITFHALGRVRRQFQGDADGFPDERMAIEDRIVEEADRIIAECPQDEEDLIRLYNADPARIRIVPCGFDPAELGPMSRPLARLDLGLDPSERIVLQLGRLVPRKGVDTVIRAIARLERDHGIAARLVVVGGTDREPDPERLPELARLQEVARDEGVAERVTFVGRRDRNELAAYYSAADVFVSTPWYEPFGITPVEAMACGTPVVGSNVGGIKFTVRDGETGYLVPPRDPEAVAERIAYLYRHPKLLSVLSRQSVRRVNDLFTWERVTGAISELYEEVLVERRLGRRDERAEVAVLEQGFDRAIDALAQSRQRLRRPMLDAVALIAGTFLRGGTVLAAGNGGSAAQASHLAAELVGRFRLPGRPGLPVVALTTDSSILTAWANDVGWEDVFARGVEALRRRGDLLVGISTSGRSPNVVRAFEMARERGVRTLALLGGDGGDLLPLADVALVVPSADTQAIQDAHSTIVHVLCELVERRLDDAGAFERRPAGAQAGDADPSTSPRRDPTVGDDKLAVTR